MTITAANWAKQDDDFSKMFLEQNIKQFWRPEDIALHEDVNQWKQLPSAQKETYKRVLGGLTLLDTLQGEDGMTNISLAVPGHQRKAVLNFMAMMENVIHARSYSNIFLTLASREEIDEVFAWVEANPHLQRKAEIIEKLYRELSAKPDDEIVLYKALVASVMLESFLFYSGFYYPLLLAGEGKLTHSGEIISLIIRDESIHGVYVGLLAQEIYAKQSADMRLELRDFTIDLLVSLYENESAYTDDVYSELGLEHDVRKFLRYNANKALANLGFDPYFEDEKQSAIVLNGLSTKTKSHDFFSQKGNGYVLATVESLQDSDFIFQS
ncbi:class 1b ribonucleoside-diphosphate reductase subunit beta [Cytobacillus sp. FSL R7-0696]|uniref:class 1b ribonucleoside-diphosphate reductase subunit beta n=1 Tax=Cytobacillus sp. FSL R7-0696 TaxID=2921691 RepID=UPI0030F65CD3